MKKFISLILAFVVILSLTACKPADNEYVKLAKKHGYWYGLGGISWGMPIDECVGIIKEFEGDIEIIESQQSNDYNTTYQVAFMNEISEKEAAIVFEFIDYMPLEENSACLYSIRVVFKEENLLPVEVYNAGVDKVIKAIGLTYNTKKTSRSNSKSLSDLPDSDAKTETVAYLTNWENKLNSNALPPYSENLLLDKPLDCIFTFEIAGEISNIFIDGTNAALLATYEMGRTP